MIFSVLLEVFKVEVGQARYQQLKLLVVENTNKLLWNQFIEALKEVIYLLLNLLIHLEVCKLLNIFSLILISHLYVLSILNEIYLFLLSEIVSDGDERGH